jgi:hypothetical protein
VLGRGDARALPQASARGRGPCLHGTSSWTLVAIDVDRSVLLFGTFSPLSAHDERLRALQAITNKFVPGRWSEVRPPSEPELRATTMLAMTIDKASAKLRSGPPTDDDSPDNALDVWAGVVPVGTSFGEPRASPGLRNGIPIPDSVKGLLQEPGR